MLQRWLLPHQQGDEYHIILIMGTVNTSETSVNFYKTTWRNLSADCHFHTCRRENLKSQVSYEFLVSSSYVSHMADPSPSLNLTDPFDEAN
jgi:hypothetical protein